GRLFCSELKQEPDHNRSHARLPELRPGQGAAQEPEPAGGLAQSVLGRQWRKRIANRQIGVRQVSAVKDVAELHAQIEAHPFLEPEGASEVHALLRMALIAVIAIELCRVSECSRSRIGPCCRIQYVGCGGIEAVAIKIHIIER